MKGVSPKKCPDFCSATGFPIKEKLRGLRLESGGHAVREFIQAEH